MNQDTVITEEQLEMMILEATLETYAAIAISLLPIAIIFVLVFHAWRKPMLTTISLILCGVITITIPSTISRATGGVIVLLGSLVLVLQWVYRSKSIASYTPASTSYSPSDELLAEDDLNTKGV